MTIILQQKIIMSAVLLLFIFAVLIQIRMNHYYAILILETEKMATTQIDILCQCKRKYTNNYRLNNGVVNVSVFVEKYLNKMRMGKCKISTWKNLSGQLVLFAVFAAGLGVCISIIQGSTFGEILPFYIVSMFGLYFYFAISGALDIADKRDVLKINLVDYLENHMGNKIDDLEDSIKMINNYDEEKKDNKQELKRGKKNAAELEELLKEYFA